MRTARVQKRLANGLEADGGVKAPLVELRAQLQRMAAQRERLFGDGAHQQTSHAPPAQLPAYGDAPRVPNAPPGGKKTRRTARRTCFIYS